MCFITQNRTMFLSLEALPIEIIYKIFDQLNDKQLFLSAANVCKRWNRILNSYKRFHVK